MLITGMHFCYTSTSAVVNQNSWHLIKHVTMKIIVSSCLQCLNTVSWSACKNPIPKISFRSQHLWIWSLRNMALHEYV